MYFLRGDRDMKWCLGLGAETVRFGASVRVALLRATVTEWRYSWLLRMPSMYLRFTACTATDGETGYM